MNKFAFSLIELIVMLVIASVVTAAVAPVITKKIDSTAVTIASSGETCQDRFGEYCTNCNETSCLSCSNTCSTGTYRGVGCLCVKCSETHGAYCSECNANECSACESGYELRGGRCTLTCSGTGCYTKVGSFYMTKFNIGDSSSLPIPSSVTVLTAGSGTCPSGAACCWKGRTSNSCDNTNGGYSGCNRTVCNYAAAQAACSSLNLDGKPWRLPDKSELASISVATESVGQGSNGIMLCDENVGYSSARCMPNEVTCAGANYNKCFSNTIWGTALDANTGHVYYLLNADWKYGFSDKTCALSVRCISCGGTCPSGQFLDKSTCTCKACSDQFGSGCSTCTDAGCSTCASTHYKSGTSCVACGGSKYGEKCTTCTDTTCSTCSAGYYVSGTTCSACSTKHSACTACTSDACTACSSGYVVKDKTCKTCAEAYGATCATCDSTSCTSCSTGYYLASDKTCKTCSSNATFTAYCTKCNSSACTECDTNKGYGVSGSGCAFTCVGPNFMQVGSLCVTRRNMGDSDILPLVGSGYSKLTAGTKCNNSSYKCCWQGTTATGCSTANGDYSGCTRTICTQDAARIICPAFGYAGKTWRLPNTTELQNWYASYSKGKGNDGLMLCDAYASASGTDAICGTSTATVNEVYSYDGTVCEGRPGGVWSLYGADSASICSTHQYTTGGWVRCHRVLYNGTKWSNTIFGTYKCFANSVRCVTSM